MNNPIALANEIRGQIRVWKWVRWLYLLSPLFLPQITNYWLREYRQTFWVLAGIASLHAITNWRGARNRLLLCIVERETAKGVSV